MSFIRSFFGLLGRDAPRHGVSSWRIFVQLLVYLAGFALVLGIDQFFTGLVKELQERSSNERARLLIGEVLVQDLMRLEAGVYRLVVNPSVRAQPLILKNLKDELSLFVDALDVLEHGGVIRRQTWLNMEGQGSLERRIEYRIASESERYVLEAIDLRPKVAVIEESVMQLAELLAKRERLRETSQTSELERVEAEINLNLRRFGPLFTRMVENANRLYYISQQQLQRFEDDIAAKTAYYARLQWQLAAGVILAVLVVGYMVMRQVTLSNRQLRELAGDLSFQKFALDQHALVIIGDQEGQIHYANAKYCDLVQLSAPELLGKDLFETLFGKAEREVRRQVQSGLVLGKVWHGEIRNHSARGGEFWLDATLVPFVSDREPFKYIAICTDISSRKWMQHQVDDSNRFLRNITDNLGEGVYALDALGQCTFLNREGERLLGWRQQDVIGKNLHDLIHYLAPNGQPLSAQDCPANQAIHSGQPYQSENELFFHRDGRFFPVAMTAVPLFENEHLSGSVAVFQDITQRKRYERDLAFAKVAAEEASQAKSRFLANMSHEIRTPMNAIIGMSYLALRTPLDDRQRGYIEKVHRSAENLLGVLNDILDFSKIEANHMELERLEFHLDEVLANLANLLSLRAEDKGLELLFDVPADVPRRLIGDALRLTQVLVNLGNNAVKFTEQGEVVVRVRLRSREAAQARLMFEVRDSGIGMNAEQQRRLFESFSQADASTTRKYGGTGLGLSISKGLVELMGGEIRVSSEPGRGSTFSFDALFTLPESAQEGPASAGFTPLEGEMRALVVDDSAMAREILGAMLRAFGMRVDEAAGCAEALELLRGREARYQLVLLDWRMPQVDGLACVERLAGLGLAEWPALVLVTAYSREEALKGLIGRHREIKAVLTKPVSQSSLLDAVHQALGGLASHTPPERRRERDHGAHVQALAGARVLLVEDNEYNQELALELLRLAHVSVEVAGNGQEALDLLARSRYDGVLMDCQMPVMDGYSATRRIRAHPQWRELPVIAMTANAMVSDVEQVLAAGMNDHIPKPINVGQMYATMAKWIRPAQPLDPASIQPQPSVVEESDLTLRARCAHFQSIDAEEGAARLEGDWVMYHKLLLKFAGNQANSADTIKEALRGANLELATRLAHTLKGTGASIGALGLAGAAAELEKRLKAGDDRVDDRIAEVERQLRAVLADIAILAVPGLASPAQSPALDSGSLGPRIAQLRRNLAEFDTESEAMLEALIGVIAQADMVEALGQVRQRVAQYDFEGALRALDDFCFHYHNTEN